MSSCDDDVGFWVQNLDSTQSAEVFIEKNVEVASQSYVLRNTRANEQQNQQFPGSKLVKLWSTWRITELLPHFEKFESRLRWLVVWIGYL